MEAFSNAGCNLEGGFAEWEGGERDGSRGDEANCLLSFLSVTTIPHCLCGRLTLNGAKIRGVRRSEWAPVDSFWRLTTATSLLPLTSPHDMLDESLS